jgi:hypothetical protein
MKITSVTAHLVKEWRTMLFVKVETDEGLIGIGEGGLTSREEGVAGIISALAPLLVGDFGYGKRVIATDSHPHNWQELAEHMQFETSGRAEVMVDLVLQPTHPVEQHAIAATLGGLVIGYVPRVEAVQLYEFIHKLGGVAKVNANVYFDPIGGKNRVEIDWTLPLATNDMFKPGSMRHFGDAI